MPAGNNNRTRIITTIIALAVAGGVFYVLKQRKIAREYDYYAYFKDVQGLQPSSPVMIRGVRVGKITRVDLEANRLRVVITTKKGIELTEGTIASLSSGGFTGDKIIDLIPGAGPGILPDKATLVTNLDSAILPLSVRIAPMFNTAKILLHTADASLQEFSYMLDRGIMSTATRSLISLEENTRSYAKLSAGLNKNADGIVNTIVSFDTNTRKLAAKNGEVKKTVTDAERSTANLANKQLKEDIRKLGNSFTALGKTFKGMNDSKVLNDKQAVQDADKSIKELDKSLTETYTDPQGMVIFGGKKKDKAKNK